MALKVNNYKSFLHKNTCGKTFPQILTLTPKNQFFHSWSSNGRWVVFSSRRDDGLFTRLYISHFDREGKAHKPFMLPLKDPGFYGKLLKSYNVPEFVNGITDLNPRKLLKAVYSDPVNAGFNDSANFQKPNDH